MTYCYIDIYDDEICEDSSWDDWGRWVLAGVLIGAFVLIFVGYILFARMTSRKRQRQGMKPYYGTAWAAPPAYSPNDPHPEAKDLVENPAPSYQAATSNGERVQNSLNTTSNAQGNHETDPPPRIADPDSGRAHEAV